MPIDMSAAQILADEIPDSEIPFSRKTAANQKKFLAQIVHEEYANHAERFSTAFPKLEKLQIDDGHFSFKTLDLFPPVAVFKIKGTMNPDPADVLSEEQLQTLTNLTISSFSDGQAKLLELLTQLVSAQRLQKLTLDLAKVPLKGSSLP